MKKIFFLQVAAQLLFCVATGFTQTTNYQQLKDGVLFYPQNGSAKAVQLRVVQNGIVQVVASPSKEIQQRKSLVVLEQPAFVNWKVVERQGKLFLTTNQLTVEADLLTGAVAFANNKGQPIVSERISNGRSIIPAMYEGEQLFAVKQVFETSTNDAYYGLGQHQDDVWNYKGQQVIFFQNNTEVAVPFLVSVKNYGILWDNYSYSRAGDVRPYLPLASLALFDANGKKGWLTALYANDKDKPADLLFEKAETELSYPFINDTKQKLPAAFKPEKGSITWQGSIASNWAGKHKLKFTYGGYLNVWLNNELVLNKWRQSWNPGTGLIEPFLEKGKRYSIKIEWIPDGGESYFNAEVLPPQPIEDENSFAFDSEAGRQIDYYFVYGNNIDEVISGYRKLTGKAPIIPKWAAGFWQSRERYKSQEELLQTVAEFRKRKIPLDNIVQDWFYWRENEWGSQEFDEQRFPNADSMINVLHKQHHAQFMISVWPKFYEGINNYHTFNKNNWLYTSNIADRTKDWVGPGYVSTFYDVFNDSARNAFWQLLNRNLFRKNVDAWWMDASEPDILSNASPTKRKQQMNPLASGTAAEFLNAYPLQNAKGIYEGQRSVNNNQRVFLLTRSAFAGSQRYAASIWSGDIGARWEDMRTQITAGLNYSLSGLPYWTMDIGGFATESRYNKTPMREADEKEWRELQTRWYQWGSFLPLFRSHGQFPFREIFHIAPEHHPAYQSMLYYSKLRYRLLPYIYSIAGHSYHNDYTIMRGLVMDFASDERVHPISDQFMFGPSLLINPVYQYNATERTVYLPAGQGWYNLYNGNYYQGAQTIKAAAPYERVPVFVKEGSIIPAGSEMQYVAEKPADVLTLFVYAGKDASFTLYEDEGINYNYEKGMHSEITFSYSETTKSFTVSDRKGSFNGMLKNRLLNIVLINKQKPLGMQFNLKPSITLKYNGSKQTVLLK